MFNKILLPLDGSPLAELSIPHAIEFARIFNSQILILHVVEHDPVIEAAFSTDPLKWQLHRTKTEHYLLKVANQIRSALDLPETDDQQNLESRVSVTLLEGKVAESIVDFAHKEKIDLLVITSHGSSGLSRWNLNSVTTKVINQIYTPFLIIRGYPSAEKEQTPPRYERIVLPTDCSRRSECSLTAGVSIAHYYQSKVFLATVIRSPDVYGAHPYNIELQSLIDQCLKLSRKIVRHYMDDLAERLDVDKEVRILEDQNIFKAIITLADKENADLLVFCAHGQSGELSWPFGSVARTFIEYTQKPILVIQDLFYQDAPPSVVPQNIETTRSRD